MHCPHLQTPSSSIKGSQVFLQCTFLTHVVMCFSQHPQYSCWEHYTTIQEESALVPSLSSRLFEPHSCKTGQRAGFVITEKKKKDCQNLKYEPKWLVWSNKVGYKDKKWKIRSLWHDEWQVLVMSAHPSCYVSLKFLFMSHLQGWQSRSSHLSPW